uniref:iron-containing alcohol dehydrogenase n=1 Tax=Bacillus velezensis TaxID=492670 RepID=UPI0021B5FE60
MNPHSLITSSQTNQKFLSPSNVTHPPFSILHPHNTFTLPQNQTLYRIVDIITHLFQQYFHNLQNTPLQHTISFPLLHTL